MDVPGVKVNLKRNLREIQSEDLCDFQVGDFMFRERELFCKMKVNREEVRNAILKSINGDSASELSSNVCF